MSAVVNPARGEAAIAIAGIERQVRPSFAALVRAEQETGSLLALAERAALGSLSLSEIEALIWHCLVDNERIDRAEIGAALLSIGLTGAMPAVRAILKQLLAGAE